MAVTHGRAAAQQEERLPERIGKYEIEGVAGHGAMGTVYIGYDRFIDRRVAIKVCRFNSNDADENLRARKLFLNEAQSVGALEHPNILRIYDAGEENGLPYMVMEFVEGGNTLRSYCEARNRLDPESAVNIIARCADALGYGRDIGVSASTPAMPSRVATTWRSPMGSPGPSPGAEVASPRSHHGRIGRRGRTSCGCGSRS